MEDFDFLLENPSFYWNSFLQEYTDYTCIKTLDKKKQKFMQLWTEVDN